MHRSILRNVLSDTIVTHSKSFKSVEYQINLIEKHVNNLKVKIRDYCNSKESEGKYFIQISTIMNQYAEFERDQSFKLGVNEMAKILCDVNKQLSSFSDKLSFHVVDKLSDIKPQIKHLRKDCRRAAQAADGERINQEHLKRLQIQHHNDRIVAAEKELDQAKLENKKATKALKEHLAVFEESKLSNIRRSFLLWTSLELEYHARALELFTDAHAAVLAINATSQKCSNNTLPVEELSADRLESVSATMKQTINRRKLDEDATGVGLMMARSSSSRMSELT